MRYLNLCLTLVLCTLLTQCKKKKTVVYSGQLLLSRSFPVPVANRQLNLYQSGGNAIVMGNSSSSATGNSDGAGRFRISFTPGEGYFLGMPSTNGSPVSLSTESGDTAFPRFLRIAFSAERPHSGAPVYIGKTIQNAYIILNIQTALQPTDTIALEAMTVHGNLRKTYTGLSAPANSELRLDTIANMLFTYYDARSQKFSNQARVGRQVVLSSGWPFILSNFPMPSELSANDTSSQELRYTYTR